MIRILIADDHPIVRRGLTQILADEADITVTGEAKNGLEALQMLRQRACDVVVLDINMPLRSGLEVLQEIREQYPKLAVLVMSIHAEEQFGLRVLKGGASGYLTKESAPEELVQAIRKVHSGGKYVSRSLAETLALALQTGADQPLHQTLTDREFQVLRLIATGKTVSEIADQLCLSVKTISTYRARTLEKMRMQTNAQLMQYAVHNHLVD